jgi:molybdate transport system substrate-binding protein
MIPRMRIAALAFAGGLAATGQAAEVRMMSGGAMKTAILEAAAAWEKQSGHRLVASFAPAGELRKRVGAGEVADILVVPAENLAEYEKSGAIDPASRRDLAVVGMGAAVRKGAPVPDISTPEALKRTLLGAKSLTYMDPGRGTSGKHFDETVLPRLGIRDEVRAKATLGEGGFIAEKVARGEVEIAFHQMSEMLPVAGITIVGPLPRELQKETVYSAALMKGGTASAAARSLLDYLVSAEGRKVFAARGFTSP